MTQADARQSEPRPFAKPLAIITGAAGGMGQACARRLSNTHALILADYHPARLEAFAETLREQDNAEIVATLSGDISDDATIRQIAQAADVAHTCKVLVHSAGLSPALAGWESIVKTNMVGTAKLLDAIERLLSPGFVGVILASTARCFVPPPGAALSAVLDQPLADDLMDQLVPHLGDGDEARAKSAYAYTKAWVCRTVQQRAMRWAGKGARIASLSPGFILTGMTRKEIEVRPEMRDLLDATPVGRWGTVNDIADAVDFVLSDRASFITGTDLIIDGGLTAHVLNP